jgi:hypothetical protein
VGLSFFFLERREKHIQIRFQIPLTGVADLHHSSGGRSLSERISPAIT